MSSKPVLDTHGRKATNKAFQFYGTIELLADQHAAIVSLTDGFGEWAGAGRIDVRPIAFETTAALCSRLYEIGYTHASRSAYAKGGRLETYKVVSP
jgi:hypothetical protein